MVKQITYSLVYAVALASFGAAGPVSAGMFSGMGDRLGDGFSQKVEGNIGERQDGVVDSAFKRTIDEPTACFDGAYECNKSKGQGNDPQASK